MLSFGFNNQSLAQNVSDTQFHANKIKISADNPPVPSYLSHSKKARKITTKQQKKDTPKAIIGKMFKALFLAIAMFFGLVALLFKNKDRIENQWPLLLAKMTQKSVPKSETETTPEIQPEIINADKQIRHLVFKFFNINK